MYNTAVIGQGLTGLFAAILSAEKGGKTAVISNGAGKWLQSSGLFDFTPGFAGDYDSWSKQFGPAGSDPKKAVDAFLQLTKEVGYPYAGSFEQTVSVVTGSGHLKQTQLYPPTMRPIPDKGNFLVVGFEEVIDFQPAQAAGNLQRECPGCNVSELKVSLGERSSRGMSQTDAARLLDRNGVRQAVIASLKAALKDRDAEAPDVVVFPALLGMKNWAEAVNDFEEAFGCAVTEAPGLPPNAGALRLYQLLKKRAVRLGVRFYENTAVNGAKIQGNRVGSLGIEQGVRRQNLQAEHFIAATGGILGSGLIDTLDGFEETALQLEVDANGTIIEVPENLYPVGAAAGIDKTRCGITGGIYSLVSGYDAVDQITAKRKGGDSRALTGA
ncbi:FAD-binding protein [Salisediminibacterium halotolerans]|uniref:FAD-binding protein n=1 Tax=Salisediminibacterium halotolerans TaxID=517425 RepID=UPI000F127925|nr:FAD-binding protein [Salisediminibacterium halotolerans]RLJ71718.1 glycerol 3-phosphate dehydrogenase (quinone) subunit B [Actinophytocola xinjiangensis]RPE86868.1 glycerol 3-phosphate dehydrogenase (quinone) subunit B [Salisediminibacterium halotolerans]TWG32931.1 glycerol 3-phosphate dehydrogenase (quinone) subunit B [Salisediminibacterium halotolerans]GEL08197.1 anaerobic glycerol-3-phosphate dehydrogenase subunit B [Salisediminibacterium halotolerans]